jgi:hypothetical protein
MTTRASDDAWVPCGGAGSNVKFLTPTHPAEAAPRQARLEAARPIVVGDNVWLGGWRDGLSRLWHRGEHRGRCRRGGIRDLPANVVAVATQLASSPRCDRWFKGQGLRLIQTKALRPVIARPTIRVLISRVPS